MRLGSEKSTYTLHISPFRKDPIVLMYNCSTKICINEHPSQAVTSRGRSYTVDEANTVGSINNLNQRDKGLAGCIYLLKLAWICPWSLTGFYLRESNIKQVA